MTSTVLDVTVLLLCVSASVVALDAADGGGPDGPTAAEAADRLVTETATVGYPDDDGPNETRRVHATRAEVLAILAARDADEPFDRRAARTVRSGIGPRTRVDAAIKRGGETEAAGTNGGPWNSEASRANREPGAWAAGASIPPWTDDGSIALVADDESNPTWLSADPAAETRDPIVVGPEPPRDADVTAAVVRQPIPDTADGRTEGRGGSVPFVRIVVRRW